MKAYLPKPRANTRIVASILMICVSALGAHAQEKGKVAALGPKLRASLDKAVLVRMPDGMRTIVIGNPAVAHVSFDKSGFAVVSGRSFGETNMIVLDDNGDVIAETDLVVSDDRKSLVSVQSGISGKVTVACDPRCQPVAAVGDDDRAFTGLSGQFNQLTSAAQQAAAASAGSAPVAAAVVSAPPSASAPEPSMSRPAGEGGVEEVPQPRRRLRFEEQSVEAQ
ncbi:pilus assembly protein N-terminal domain-containing protein [Microvirga sp. BT688]|uniref:pilus assembly protein N-terminal domain-containing protein n=1 Tax=Microvirga sp. TaxID=1873136 RepID=UPI001684362E|nr:pilus assembly protein N-terminal domain-containing protein [Microvirga sp.]MBD2745770.1 pilus assembly protein N-terminal domain-containing protein [Microvirga sp.]